MLHVQSAEYGETPKDRASVAFVVLGQLPSMKNSKTSLRYQNPDVKAYRRDFWAQVPAKYRNLSLGSATVPLRVILSVFYRSYRSDLETALVYDCLQECGVISNDRWAREQHHYGDEIDAKNPRVEIQIEEI